MSTEFLEKARNNAYIKLPLSKTIENIDLKENSNSETEADEKILEFTQTQSANNYGLKNCDNAENSTFNKTINLPVFNFKKTSVLEGSIDTRELANEKNQKLDLPKTAETRNLKNSNGIVKFPNNATLKLPLPESTETSDLEDVDDIVEFTKDSILKLPVQKSEKKVDCVNNQNFSSGCSLNISFLKSKLDKSIEDKNDIECKSLLESEPLINIWPLIAAVLAKARASGNEKIVKIIHSSIRSNSTKTVIDFCKKYEAILKDTKIWMGTECTCSKEDKKKYEDELCESSKLLLIVETNDESNKIQIEENFHDFPIKVITSSSLRRNESKAVAQRIIPESHQKLDRVPKSVAKRLFKKHSNLTMVCPSAYKSICFGLKEQAVFEINCISLFCRVKGIIPIGEYHFPLKIRGVQTDVLEGTSHFTSALHIGDKIYNHKREVGTLGGFVKYYGFDTFLTCAHVIFGKSNISNLQKKDIHFNFHTLRNADDPNPVQCTLIRHILKNDTHESGMGVDDGDSADDEEDETGIDAALVLIPMPNIFHDSTGGGSGLQGSTETASSGHKPVELRIKLHGCVNPTEESLSALGLRSIYLNENFFDSDIVYSRAIALSSFSGEQERLISSRKREKVYVLVPSHVKIGINIMYNQIIIQNMDFKKGDSGTCIYASGTGSQEKGCIGMLIGKFTSGECIVTPMKEILKALEVDI